MPALSPGGSSLRMLIPHCCRHASLPAKGFLGVLCLAVAGLPAPGCQSGYLAREALGFLSLQRRREAIDETLLARMDAGAREKLLWAGKVREFAAKDLGLEPGGAYTAYLDTKGLPVSTIVVAAHPLALQPYRWHFPIAGTVPYKGFFEPERAKAERDRLRSKGLDAVCLPVGAFSTLGWFDDPVLSTLLDLPRSRLAEILIHEMTHRTVYFPDRPELSEGVAEFLGRAGAEALLRSMAPVVPEGASGSCADELREFLEDLALQDLRDRLAARLRSDLDALYRSRLPDPRKLERKAEIFATAARTFRAAGLNPVNGGRDSPGSNAPVVLDHQYQGNLPLLRRSADALGGDLKAFVAILKEIRDAEDPLEALSQRIAEARREPVPGAEGSMAP